MMMILHANGSNTTVNAVDDDSVVSDLLSVALGILLGTLIFASVAGNVLVCIAVATDVRLRKLSNLFLVSLAIADLLVAGM